MLPSPSYTERVHSHLSTDKQKAELTSWVQSLAPWSVIAHHTFTWESSIWAAQKSFEKFMAKEVRGVSYFYAVEQNPSRAGHHVHALWADCDEVFRKRIWERWFERYGRNRIEPVNSLNDVAAYCAKYVTKEGAWWNLKILGNKSLPFAAARSRENHPPRVSPGSS